MSDAERSYEKALKAAHDETQLYADYWRGSLGRYLRGSPKGQTHEALSKGRVSKRGEVRRWRRHDFHIWNLVAAMLDDMGYRQGRRS